MALIFFFLINCLLAENHQNDHYDYSSLVIVMGVQVKNGPCNFHLKGFALLYKFFILIHIVCCITQQYPILHTVLPSHFLPVPLVSSIALGRFTFTVSYVHPWFYVSLWTTYEIRHTDNKKDSVWDRLIYLTIISICFHVPTNIRILYCFRVFRYFHKFRVFILTT